MPSARVLETFVFGGCDGRSNPLAFPPNRSLRCVNFCPQPSQYLKLRYGYSVPVIAGTTISEAIHTAFYFESVNQVSPGGNPEQQIVYVGAGTSLYQIIIGAGGNTCTQITTLTGPPGATVSLDGYPFDAFIADNQAFFCDGTSQLMADGTDTRPSGIRAPTASEGNGVQVNWTAAPTGSPVMGPSTATQTHRENDWSSLGSLNAQDGVYATATLYGTTGANESSILQITGFGFAIPANSTIQGVEVEVWREQTAGTSAVYDDVVQLLGAGTSNDHSSTAPWAPSGAPSGELTVTYGSNIDTWGATLTSTVVNSPSFGVQLGCECTGAAGGGTGADIGIDYVAVTVFWSAASAISPWGPTTATGYQFAMAYYNPITGHVGNFEDIGPRLTMTATASQVVISGLPNLSGVNSEWVKLIGRTYDGTTIPYAMDDPISGDWVVVGNTQTVATLTASSIDYTSPLPTRNGLPPSSHACCYALGRAYWIDDADPHLLDYSEAESDLYGAGSFVGQPPQSFAPLSQIPFPKNETLRGVHEFGDEVWAQTRTFLGIVTELGNYSPDGVPSPQYRGIWVGGGICGQRAFIKTPYGPYWVTPERELMTWQINGPIPASTEYQAALLAQLGTQYLTSVEVSYLRDPERDIDRLYITGLDDNASPILIVHDFLIPPSGIGEGYQYEYTGICPTVFVRQPDDVISMRDATQRWRLWVASNCGSSTGSARALPEPCCSEPRSGGGPAAYVQSASNVDAGFTTPPTSYTMTLALPNPTTAGNIILVLVLANTYPSGYYSVGSFTLSDSQGNAYWHDPVILGNGFSGWGIYLATAQSGSVTVTATASVTSGQIYAVAMYVAEYSNIQELAIGSLPHSNAASGTMSTSIGDDYSGIAPGPSLLLSVGFVLGPTSSAPVSLTWNPATPTYTVRQTAGFSGSLLATLSVADALNQPLGTYANSYAYSIGGTLTGTSSEADFAQLSFYPASPPGCPFAIANITPFARVGQTTNPQTLTFTPTLAGSTLVVIGSLAHTPSGSLFTSITDAAGDKFYPCWAKDASNNWYSGPAAAAAGLTPVSAGAFLFLGPSGLNYQADVDIWYGAVATGTGALTVTVPSTVDLWVYEINVLSNSENIPGTSSDLAIALVDAEAKGALQGAQIGPVIGSGTSPGTVLFLAGHNLGVGNAGNITNLSSPWSVETQTITSGTATWTEGSAHLMGTSAPQQPPVFNQTASGTNYAPAIDGTWVITGTQMTLVGGGAPGGTTAIKFTWDNSANAPHVESPAFTVPAYSGYDGSQVQLTFSAWVDTTHYHPTTGGNLACWYFETSPGSMNWPLGAPPNRAGVVTWTQGGFTLPVTLYARVYNSNANSGQVAGDYMMYGNPSVQINGGPYLIAGASFACATPTPTSLCPVTVCSDDFNDPNGPLGSQWLPCSTDFGVGTIGIVSQQCSATETFTVATGVTTANFVAENCILPQDQWVQVTYISGVGLELFVRASTPRVLAGMGGGASFPDCWQVCFNGTGPYWFFQSARGEYYIDSNTSGAPQIPAGHLNSGDVIRLEAQGAIFTIKINGVVLWSGNAPYSFGSGGLDPIWPTDDTSQAPFQYAGMCPTYNGAHVPSGTPSWNLVVDGFTCGTWGPCPETTSFFYQLEDGSISDAGATYTGDYITLFNTGVEEPVFAGMEITGDPNVIVQGAFDQLGLTTAEIEALASSTVTVLDSNTSRMRVEFDQGAQFALLRLQLTAHPADGYSLDTGKPPNIPVQFPGRIYVTRPEFGRGRGVGGMRP